MDPEIVICAAVKTKCGKIIRCHRHGHGIEWIINTGMYVARGSDAQGFITSRNRFVTRAEGYAIQVGAGIKSVAPGGYRGARLYSEDLY